LGFNIKVITKTEAYLQEMLQSYFVWELTFNVLTV